MFAVVLTGPPGAGKTVTLSALSDALVADEIAHAAVDVDEIAWAYPFPTTARRCEHLRGWWRSHRPEGHALALVAEVIESTAHLNRVLSALAADDHLVVALVAAEQTLRERIVAREPAGWSGLDWLLDYVHRSVVAHATLVGVHMTIDSERLTSAEIAARICWARSDVLSRRASSR